LAFADVFEAFPVVNILYLDFEVRMNIAEAVVALNGVQSSGSCLLFGEGILMLVLPV
jgi:hypothetical protein